MEGVSQLSLQGFLLRAYELVLIPADALPAQIWAVLLWARESVVVPAIKVAIVSCLVMSVMVMVEKLSVALVSLYARLFRRRPHRIYNCEPIKEDEELGSLAFPMVLVQIPMHNEREVYQLSIRAACNMLWPTNRVIIQVLDDSTDPDIREMVRLECEKWQMEGKNIRYETRDNRKGYKAGALKMGMEHDYVHNCEYLAMFDADFQPNTDFLIKTVPFLVHNPNLALVQARWKFVNANECMLTRLQEMSMDFHFKVEQEAGSTMFAFFGYNGTAGVWRIQAINDAGGWEDRSTVEDMDLAVRSTLRGWSFVYTGNIKVKSELPSTLKAYRSQQHRWSCGPAVLFKKLFWKILSAKFFIARRLVAPFVTFFFYCIIIPLAVFFPEVEIPIWGIFYLPAAITILNSVGTPSSFHLVLFWILFENVMSLHRCKAVFVGLFEAGSATEWIVTQKLGNRSKTSANNPIVVSKKSRAIYWERFYPLELSVAIFLSIATVYDFKFRADYFYVFFFFQSMAFFIVGFGFVGTTITKD
ncbi:hypothetical protein HPP92_027578 [Vanilla planifolia]|uniref:glucomannan 4-beta-mannosyltransferase n=1 Tax=Vanilla planifolia TaxID=51239 RepID=A0A835U483_VANPL|nr:hypothetical protein HPP92_027578 [Vanilla planifolia]